MGMVCFTPENWSVDKDEPTPDTREYREQVLPKRMLGSRILGKGRHDLDLSSRTIHTDAVKYSIRGRVSQLGIFEVLLTGPGRQQMGYHEPIGCEEGNLVLVNLRDASNWITIDAVEYCMFSWDQVMGRLKPSTRELVPKVLDCELCKQWGRICAVCNYTLSKNEKTPEWDIEMFQNYLLLEHDQEAFRQLLTQQGSKLQLDDLVATEGMRSDNEDRNRFPMLYSKLVDKGPGKVFPKWRADFANAIELVEESCPTERGMFLAYVSTMAAVQFKYYGKDMRIIHARSADFELDPPCPPKPDPSAS